MSLNPTFCQHCHDLGAELGGAEQRIRELEITLDNAVLRWADEPCAMCGNRYRVPASLPPEVTNCRACHPAAYQ